MPNIPPIFAHSLTSVLVRLSSLEGCRPRCAETMLLPHAYNLVHATRSVEVDLSSRSSFHLPLARRPQCPRPTPSVSPVYRLSLRTCLSASSSVLISLSDCSGLRSINHLHLFARIPLLSFHSGFFYPLEGVKEGDNTVRMIFRILYSISGDVQNERRETICLALC